MDRMNRAKALKTAAVVAAWTLAGLALVSCPQPLELRGLVERRVAEANTPPAPVISVFFGDVAVMNGGTLDIGSARALETKDVAFEIQNAGNAELVLGGDPAVAITGADQAAFSIQATPATPIAAGDESSFTLRFFPASAGPKTAVLTITNNAANAATFSFTVTATATAPSAPLIALSMGSTTVANGGSADIGSAQATASKDISFTIGNSGDATLVLNGIPLVAITGPDQADFSIQSTPSAAVAAGGTSVFALRFSPASTGPKSAVLTITNNTLNDSTFSFTVTATATAAPAPAVQLAKGANAVASGTTVDLGHAVSGTSADTGFTITNSGSATLVLSGAPGITGANAAEFSIQSLSSTNLSPGSSATFSIRFSPSSVGAKAATVTIASNAAAFAFTLAATGDAVPVPAIQLSQGANPIAPNGTYLYAGTIRTTSRSIIFTISNTGSGTLSLSGSPIIQTSLPATFAVTAQPSATVASGGSTTFTVNFQPSAAQTYDATVNINSNDPVNPSFAVNLSGNGVEWHGIATVDNAAAVGEYASLGVSAANVYIAYRDATNEDLNLVRSTNSALTWGAKATPDANKAGMHNSLVIAGSDVYVSYASAPSMAYKLRIAKGVGGTSWSASDVDATAGAGPDSSLAWDGANYLIGYLISSAVHVEESTNASSWSKDFSSFTRAGDHVAVAANGGSYFIASHSSSNLVVDNYDFNNEPNPWISANADGAANNEGLYVAAAMGSASSVYLAYYDATAGNLKFVKTTRTYSMGSYVLSSSSPVIVDSPNDVGQYASIATADGVTAYISYYDATNGDLRMAKTTNSGTTWSTQTVDSAGNVGQYSSIAIYGTNVYIAYYDLTNTALKIAKSLDGGSTW